MGILKNIFKSTDTNNSEENRTSPWIELRDLKTLDEIKEISKEKPVVIFKHSTRCGVSRGVLRQFERLISNYKEADFYYLDLLQQQKCFKRYC